MIITVIIIKSRKYSFYNCTCNNIYLKILNIFDVVIHLLILTISSMCIKIAAAARTAAAADIAAPTHVAAPWAADNYYINWTYYFIGLARGKYYDIK